MNHIFAICAYKESPYLEACIRSLKSQTIPTPIILCTSTPNQYIDGLAKRYDIPVYLREGESHIQEDWNFAYDMAEADLVTIAHQDDMYHKEYAATVKQCWEYYPDTTIMTTDAVIVRGKRLTQFDMVNLIKKVLRIPLRLRNLSHYFWLKKSALLFGNPIICPSCTYCKKELGSPLFSSQYQFALDWDTMLKFADRPGRWICIEKQLLYYRIHEQATTKLCIENHKREQEEAEIFNRLWPGAIAKRLLKIYGQSYKSYD